MRANLIISLAKTVKACLLNPGVCSRRTQGLLLQGAMHALVTTVLLWFTRFYTFRHNAKAYPPC